MKEEAIRALEQFKQLHLAREVDGQADMVSESPEPTKENQMEQRDLGAVLASWEEGEKAKKQKGVNFNYPDHIVPLKQRMLSALNNGARSVETVAKYAKENEKLVGLQLNLMVSRGQIGKQIVPSSGNVKYYPPEIAKEMGILTAPQPINRKKKVKQEQKRSSSSAQSPLEGKDYVSFLEKRVTEWQAESRKQAHEILELRDEANKLRNALSKAMERHGVAEEVTKLRATVEYLESKLFGSK